jgi:hypothetical protein
VRAHGRLTVDTLKAEPRLDGQHFWLSVTSDQPIVAERSMYWDRGMPGLTEGHSSHGVVEPARHWATADARAGGPWQHSTFILVANPSPTPATLTVTIKRDAGDDIVLTRPIVGMGRDTINLAAAAPDVRGESMWVIVDADKPVLVERSQYWYPEGTRGSWSAGTNTFAVPVVAADYNGCTYDVSPKAVSLPPQGGRVTVKVATTSRCSFVAQPGAAWLGVVGEASGSGLGDVTVRAYANTSGAPRSTTIAIGTDTVVVTQGAAAGAVSAPLMALDTPLNGARVGSVFRVTGWAIDLGAMNDTSGVDTIHVWAYPNPGSGAAPVFLGVAAYGGPRADVAAMFGDRTLNSGFSLTVRGLAAGPYLIVAFSHSAVTGAFTAPRTATVTVAPVGLIEIDGPAPENVRLSATTSVVGWALDAASEGETGIDTIHVWAFPAAGGEPIFGGVGQYGLARPDVAAAFANPVYTNSGYFVPLRELPRGKYSLVVFARRTGMTEFDVLKAVTIEIVPPGDAPPQR